MIQVFRCGVLIAGLAGLQACTKICDNGRRIAITAR